MTFSWLGFIVGFLSGVVWMFVIGKIAEFIRFMNIAKYQALMKGKEGEQINELTKSIKKGFGTTDSRDDSKTIK